MSVIEVVCKDPRTGNHKLFLDKDGDLRFIAADLSGFVVFPDGAVDEYLTDYLRGGVFRPVRIISIKVEEI